jgi:voltage-gated potassium channel
MEEKNKKEHKSAIDFVHDIKDAVDLRNRLQRIIFNSNTPLGKTFDIVLMLFILGSVLTIIVHSVPAINTKYHTLLYSLDWFFTVCFSIEYALRVYAAPDRKKYIFGFWGIIDFISVFPSIFSLWITGYQTIQILRIVRLLRVFKVLRLFRFIAEAYALAEIMKSSLYKIAVFMSLIFVVVLLLGSGMYVIEEGTPGFESIPASIYWSIVTITTVGYGDVSPVTGLGKFVSSIIMLAGYALIAVPTAIWSFEIAKFTRAKSTVFCSICRTENDAKNNFCTNCGDSLKEEKVS